ncbi:M23 family metallopeptidase [Trujillonella endophytica]|uniref:M23 family metallopeptidase n=1 Tax=Trujillonella endophytica TaxID=673521 RepID=UPI00147A7E44|nr:M23 family metallopeptidase [Trujillella endophytica]
MPLRLPTALPALLLLIPAVLLAPVAAAADPAVPPPPIPAGPAAGWVAPLPAPEVTRAFDAPGSPYGPGHRGVDLAAAPGTVVVAAGDGVVAFAGQVAGRPVVSIDHPNGLRTTYEPVDPAVAAGQAVVRGSPIGTLSAGHAGCPAAACLHWGLRRGEVYLDPWSLLAPPRIRLLPSA